MARLNNNFSNASEASKYLYCDGSTFSVAAYPKLAALIGTTLPDLRDRVLQGNDIGGTEIKAGLPNLKGVSTSFECTIYDMYNGVFKVERTLETANVEKHHNTGRSFLYSFNASRYNPIYSDTCNTVQPPAVTVRYYIRAK